MLRQITFKKSIGAYDLASIYAFSYLVNNKTYIFITFLVRQRAFRTPSLSEHETFTI